MLNPRCVAVFILLFCSVGSRASEVNVQDPEAQAIDWVWSGQRVWFDFVGQGKYQMVAYYDAARQMSVAVRQIGDINGSPWIYHKLPSYLGWDAHNKVEAAFDKNGIIHVIGNLHANPLVYFRSTDPYNPRSLKQVDIMVDREVERSMTYPKFFKGPNGGLHFKYRDGSSGDGRWLYNRWDTKTGRWRHLHDTVLLDGKGVRGVYPWGPKTGPDGYAHMTFVWRETPRASTNHDLSYARTKDLIHWETSEGKKIRLPISLERGEIIDPVPENSGLLNGRTPIAFDAQRRVIVTYQKYDDAGQTQVFLLRREKKGWKQVQVSRWKNSRVELDKSGALDLTVDTNIPAFLNAKQQIVVPARWRGVRWEWVLDPETLKVLSGGKVDRALPESITRFDEDNGIPQRVIPMMEEQSKASKEFFLSWEAMQPNRDQARPNIPMPSTLRVHRIPSERSAK